MERIKVGDGKTVAETELKDQRTGEPLGRKIYLSCEHEFRPSSKVDLTEEEIRIILSISDYADLGGPSMHVIFRDGGFSYHIFEVENLDDLV